MMGCSLSQTSLLSSINGILVTGDLGLKVRLMEKLCRIFSQKGHSIPLLLSAYKVLWELVVVWWSYFSGESTDGSARDAESDSQ